MKKHKIIYWIATGLVILMVGLGSFADLLVTDAIKESIKHIGFPEYMIPFFGVMKLLGVIVIVAPFASRFREAAYAGLVFYFIGAAYTHIGVGDGIAQIAPSVIVLLIVLVSYAYSRKLTEHQKG